MTTDTIGVAGRAPAYPSRDTTPIARLARDSRFTDGTR